MNERQLFDAIGRVDDDLILAADRPAVRRRKKPVYWMPALSAAACAGLLMVGVAGWRAGNSKNDFMESAAAAAETGRLISEFLRTLPEGTRNIFLRRYWYCDATTDIAARYGLTESKVRVTLHRTRGKLAAYLQKKGVAI